MSVKHLLTTSHPFKGSGTAWWYEDNGGIDIVVHPAPQCQHLHIDWAVLRRALARKDRKP